MSLPAGFPVSFPAAFPVVFSEGQVRYCPWLVCESTPRFTAAANRFAPEMAPAGAVPSVQRTTLANFREEVEPLIETFIGACVPCVVLWHFQRAEVLAVLDQVMSLAKDHNLAMGRRVLPVIACEWMGRAEELALAEIGVSVFVRHPEDLLRYASVVQAHFASFANGLK